MKKNTNVYSNKDINNKITKQMFNEELRPYYWVYKIAALIATTKWGMKLLDITSVFSRGKNIKDVHCEQRYIPSKNGGADIRVRIFKPNNIQGEIPGMLYNHGGGYAIGCPESSLDKLKNYLKRRPCVIVAPDYRKSFTNPYPAAFNDCYDTLLWMKENAKELGINPEQFIVAGHSAGGGLTAAVTLKARNTKDVKIAFQMPIYPMLDDRQDSESAINMSKIPSWNAETNKLGWELYLKDCNSVTPCYAAPARNKDYTDFPPTISYVGDMEPFKDEDIAYIEALKQAGIPVKFRVFKEAFHAFEMLTKNTKIGEEANKFEYRTFAEFYDRYILHNAELREIV